MSGDGNVKEDEQLYKENLSYACKELAKEGILCVIEPLNSHFRSTYFLNSFDLAEKIVNDLKEPNLNILFVSQLLKSEFLKLYSSGCISLSVNLWSIDLQPEETEPLNR